MNFLMSVGYASLTVLLSLSVTLAGMLICSKLRLLQKISALIFLPIKVDRFLMAPSHNIIPYFEAKTNKLISPPFPEELTYRTANDFSLISKAFQEQGYNIQPHTFSMCKADDDDSGLNSEPIQKRKYDKNFMYRSAYGCLELKEKPIFRQFYSGNFKPPAFFSVPSTYRTANQINSKQFQNSDKYDPAPFTNSLYNEGNQLNSEPFENPNKFDLPPFANSMFRKSNENYRISLQLTQAVENNQQLAKNSIYRADNQLNFETFQTPGKENSSPFTNSIIRTSNENSAVTLQLIQRQENNQLLLKNSMYKAAKQLNSEPFKNPNKYDPFTFANSMLETSNKNYRLNSQLNKTRRNNQPLLKNSMYEAANQLNSEHLKNPNKHDSPPITNIIFRTSNKNYGLSSQLIQENNLPLLKHFMYKAANHLNSEPFQNPDKYDPPPLTNAKFRTSNENSKLTSQPLQKQENNQPLLKNSMYKKANKLKTESFSNAGKYYLPPFGTSMYWPVNQLNSEPFQIPYKYDPPSFLNFMFKAPNDNSGLTLKLIQERKFDPPLFKNPMYRAANQLSLEPFSNPEKIISQFGNSMYEVEQLNLESIQNQYDKPQFANSMLRATNNNSGLRLEIIQGRKFDPPLFKNSIYRAANDDFGMNSFQELKYYDSPLIFTSTPMYRAATDDYDSLLEHYSEYLLPPPEDNVDRIQPLWWVKL